MPLFAPMDMTKFKDGRDQKVKDEGVNLSLSGQSADNNLVLFFLFILGKTV